MKSINKMPIVVGVDIGLVNLAFSSYNTSTKEVFAGKASLLQPKSGVRYKYNESNLSYLVTFFVQDHSEMFQNADLVVVENQMRRNMLIIQHSIMTSLLICGIKTRVAFPRLVRQFFSISKNNYAKNKQASIDFIPKLLNKTQQESINLAKYGSKKDDIAEAVILAFYAFRNYQSFNTIAITESKSTTKSSYAKKRKKTISSSKTRKKTKTKSKSNTKRKRPDVKEVKKVTKKKKK